MPLHSAARIDELKRSAGCPSRKHPAERLIVGLGAFAHDTAIALMRGGKVLFAAEQERFDRRKHSRAIPCDALAAGLAAIGATFADIDDIVLNYDSAFLIRAYFGHLWRHLPGSLRMAFDSRRYLNAWKSGGYRRNLLTFFDSDGGHVSWHQVRHHAAHAASAFYRSPFERAAVLTSDALGEFESVARFSGEGTRLRLLDTLSYPHSLAAVYSAVTDHLGFRIYGGEGKVMGLAAYGFDQEPVDLSPLLTLSDDGLFRVDTRFFRFHTMPFLHSIWVSPRFSRRFGERRSPTEPLGDRHACLAAGLQRLSDRVVCHLGRGAVARAGSRNVCYAGGSALNGYGNTALLGLENVDQLFVQPAANDAGSALGAALFHSHHVLGLPRDSGTGDTCLGPEFAETACESALQQVGLSYRKPGNLAEETAALLAQNEVVGWFQGRMEFGPRALGSRSLLAHPGPAWMRDHLNRDIKQREPFRPLAPIVPAEDAHRFFVLPCPDSPFMLLIVPVREEWRERLPAITHVDGTTRPQTVRAADNPALHGLLRAFERCTGIPVLLNTSFNGPDEPIVCTPEEAIASARGLGLDALALGPFLARLR